MKVHGVQSETLCLLRERNYQRHNFCLSDFAKGIKQVSMIGKQIMHEQTIDNREQRTDFAKTFASTRIAPAILGHRRPLDFHPRITQ